MFAVKFPQVDNLIVYSLEHEGRRVRGKLSNRRLTSMTIWVDNKDSEGVPAGAVLDVRHEERGIIGSVVSGTAIRSCSRRPSC